MCVSFIHTLYAASIYMFQSYQRNFCRDCTSDCLVVAHSRLADVAKRHCWRTEVARVFPLKLEIPRVRTTILQKYLELRALEFHRRNSCGRRPEFRRRPRKPSTAKPGWRSIPTLYLTAIFISRGMCGFLRKECSSLYHLGSSILQVHFPTEFRDKH